MKRIIATLLLCLLTIEPLAFAGIGSDVIMYVGGTENQIKGGAEGKSSERDEKNFVFHYKGGSLSIPYDQVNDLEYGQKAGRRLGVAIMVTPLAHLFRKRENTLSVSAGKTSRTSSTRQCSTGQGTVRNVPSSLSRRTGRRSTTRMTKPARAIGRHAMIDALSAVVYCSKRRLRPRPPPKLRRPERRPESQHPPTW